MAAEALVARGDKHDDADDAALAVAAAANSGKVLPTDMLLEVLLRLPADELCRLRLVSRSWRSLTSEPSFAAAHASRHPPHAAAFHPGGREVHVIDLQSGDIVKRVRLDRLGLPTSALQNLLGASPACRWWQACALDVASAEIADAIAEQVEIDLRGGVPWSMVGHVPSTGEYKVITICSYHEARYNDQALVLSQFQTCDVVTIGGGRKRRERPRPPATLELDPRYTAVAGGVAYYLINWWSSGNIDRDSIASFDMATEWRLMTLHGPPIFGVAATNGGVRPYTCYLRCFGLASLNGCLAAVHLRGEQDFTTDIWKLEDMERSLWTNEAVLLAANTLGARWIYSPTGGFG